ncbi:sensor histidine kinase [Dyella psychrodurans]|uniref:Sensor histidine kinase n=1 Tax=Dyella psychrodurans TaxID=1927960 RepID=A0A370XB22_9GAMM|nr:sensor histidine kinase [Dyella psychrodurans]RDS85461.1 sensor histidine kinase [Dyella psychrodurans]
MTIHAAVRNWFTPAPDSYAARSVRRGKSPWVDAIHLLWSIWVFIIPAFDHYTWQWGVITLVTYPLFLALYAKTCVASQKQTPMYALSMIALCFALMPWYASSFCYFIYGCVMLRSCRFELRTYMATLATLNLIFVGEALLLHYPWQSVVSIPVTSFIIGIIIKAETTTEEKDAELRLSHDEVRRLAATAERERIGRDLHDLLGHTLSLITLKLELSRKLFDRDSAAAKRELEEAERVARHALAEVRAAVTGIRSTDLAAELASARLLLESSAVHLDCGNLPDSLPPDVERGLALVIREATTNIHRHAEASEASVRFTRTAEKLDMQICDNGRGGLATHGNGVNGMHERVRALGGNMQIDSPPRRGTRLLISVPLRAHRHIEHVAGDSESLRGAA